MADSFDGGGRSFGPYVTVRRLGVGGMGETFLAVRRGEHAFEQRVCIKTIHEAYRSAPEFVELFVREATIAASLRHSNIVSVIGVDHAEAYMVLELVDGADLRTVVRESPSKRLSAALANWIVLELAKALEYAHARTLRGMEDGVVHRDISPSNVLISYAGEVKLTDFGIAKAMRATTDKGSAIKGKIVYMSPEQIKGRAVDGRSDLFSTGVLMYELLTGHRPFDGDDEGTTFERIVSGTHVPIAERIPDIPAGLASVVDRLLAVDPAERFPSASVLIDALSRFSPPTNTYRALGALARRALPHETLLTDDLSAIARGGTRTPEELAPLRVGASNAREGVVPTEVLDSEPAPPEPGAGRARASGASGGAPPVPTLAASAVPTPRANGVLHLHRRHAIALASVIALVAVVVGSLAAMRMKSGDRQPLAGSSLSDSDAAGAKRSIAFAPAETNPSVPPLSESASAPSKPPSLPNANSPTSDEPDPSRVASRAEATTKKPSKAARVRTPSSAAIPTGTLEIGVFPGGKVWIDGHLRGRAPLNVSVITGRHTVAVGQDHPVETRQITVEPGKTVELIFNVRAPAGKSE